MLSDDSSCLFCFSFLSNSVGMILAQCRLNNVPKGRKAGGKWNAGMLILDIRLKPNILTPPAKD